MMTTSMEITNTFTSIATTTKEAFSTEKDDSTSPSTPGKHHTRARRL